MPELLPLFIKYADCVGVLLCRYGFKYNILARLATFDYGLSARSVVIIESNADNFCMKIALNDEFIYVDICRTRRSGARAVGCLFLLHNQTIRYTRPTG